LFRGSGHPGRGTREERGNGRKREKKGGEGEGRGLDERGSWTLEIFRWIDAFGYDHSNYIPGPI